MRRQPDYEPRFQAGGAALHLTETIVDISGRPTFLTCLTAEEFLQVRQLGRAFVVEAGDSIFVQGDPHDGIYILESGCVRTYYTGPSGREITLAYWTPGHFVGGPEVFGDGTHMWSGTAVESSELLHIRGGDLRRLMGRLPSLAVGIVEGLVYKGKCYSALVHMLGTRSILERLAQLLVVLVDLNGVVQADGTVIERDLTHEELANMVGSTRQWITASLDRFQKQGLVRVGGRQLTVLDVERLKRMAAG